MVIKQLTKICAVILLAFTCAVNQQVNANELAVVQPNIQAAVDSGARPEKDVNRDVARKPFDVMSFSGIKSGDVVADIGSAGGYYTRILSDIVGSEGHVHGFNGKEFARIFKNGNPTDPIAEERDNVTSIMGTFNAPTFSEPLDAAIIVLIYHDTQLSYLGIDTASMNRSLFDALKPGGSYLVIDHVAEMGSGLRDVDKMHRADPVLVRQEIEAAGFEFVAESDILRNSEDALNSMVMLPAMRGKTDRFILKFKKPE
ncbi:MAG: class I SAM-dependent methyltransferase [Pseudomonadales bacterium]|tara:strand:+ start:1138 stop:1908 length:771 start_codon:yes stop_codon:yes gene_type:complete